MQHALRLAGRALGRVAPNPAVGCIIVSPDGRVVGRGHTRDGGRPHAEAVALMQAGFEARGATAFVTLEPCAHHGQTPPCAEALVKAGVARVVAAIEDPDRRVSGRGFAFLRDAGVEVSVGQMADEAASINAGFFLRVCERRPVVTLKIAATLDGRIAAASGESKWITGEEARRFGHLLRAQHDAILVGIRTALADDPELSCRLAGLESYSPIRIVLDSRLQLDAESKLARGARSVPTLVFTTAGGGERLRAMGVDIVRVEGDPAGRPDLRKVLENLAERGITRLLVEGGAAMHAAFLDRGYADRLEIFRAPSVLGGAGKAAIDALARPGLAGAPQFVSTGCRRLGSDLLESYAHKA
jgi:diaminohydroxyphosphoribosylaminopyrimidine deaminase/5-amino-6-(5-phosphoribosylamino)uracil reductase